MPPHTCTGILVERGFRLLDEDNRPLRDPWQLLPEWESKIPNAWVFIYSRYGGWPGADCCSGPATTAAGGQCSGWLGAGPRS